MDNETILIECRGACVWITLNRPEQMNTISSMMLDELKAVITEIESNDGIRGLVITGSGKAFCAGADLHNVLASINKAPPGGKDFMDKCEDVFRQLRRFPKPVVAALNGLTVAGGLELAMCCDLIFAAESARIGDGHSNYGIFPGAGGAAILPRRVGLNRAKYLLYSGDLLLAAELEKFGLVNRVVQDADLVKEVENFMEKISEKSAVVLRRMKAVANASVSQTENDALRYEMLTLRQHYRSYDLQEGIKAFKEKRKPEFKGY